MPSSRAACGTSRSVMNRRFAIGVILFVVTAIGCAPSGAVGPSTSTSTSPTCLRSVYTANEGAYTPADEPGAHADTQRLTWLFHLVFHSNEASVFEVERVDMTFLRGDETLWEESRSLAYMERTEWIAGAFADTTEYFMDNIEFVDNHMSAIETAVPPELPPGEPVSWVRIPVAAKWFADADRIDIALTLSDEGGAGGVARHTVPLVRPDQQSRASPSVRRNVGGERGERSRDRSSPYGVELAHDVRVGFHQARTERSSLPHDGRDAGGLLGLRRARLRRGRRCRRRRPQRYCRIRHRRDASPRSSRERRRRLRRAIW